MIPENMKSAKGTARATEAYRLAVARSGSQHSPERNPDGHLQNQRHQAGSEIPGAVDTQ